MSSTSLLFKIIGKDEGGSKALKEVGDQAERTEGKFKGVGKIAAGVFGGEALFEGAKKVGEFFKEGVDKSVEFTKDFAHLGAIMKNAGIPDDVIEAQEKYLTSMSNTVGIAKEDLLPVYQKTFAATGNVAKAHKALSAAIDLSAGAHISLNAAVKAVDMGLGGSEGALKKYGVQAKNAGDVTEMVSKKFGGAAVASTKTFGGEVDRLKVVFDNFQEGLGAKMLPYLTRFGDWFVYKGLPSVKRFWNTTAPILAQLVKAIIAALKPAAQQLAHIFTTQVVPALKKFGDWMKDHKAQITQVAHVVGVILADAFKVLARIITTQIKVVVAIIRGAITVIKSIVTAIKATKSGVQTAFGAMVSFVRSIPHKISSAVSGMWDPIARGVHTAVSAVAGLPGKVGHYISAAVSSAGKLAGPFKTVYSWIQAVVREIGHIGSAIANVSLGKLGSIVSDVGKVAGKIPGLAVGTKFAPGGLAIVGERGPELVNLPRGARVHTAAATARILAAAGGPKDIAPVGVVGYSRGRGVASSSDGPPIEVHVHLEGRTIVTQVRKYQRSTGMTVTV